MKVYIVGAGPGDPDLLTVRALRLLESCRICVYAGSLVSPGVMALVPQEAERHDSARMSLGEIVAVYQGGREAGIDVVRLHSGDPSIYGAIGEQMNELDRLGIPYEVVPGVSAFQAAAAALQVELTAPEVSQTIILTRSAGRTPLPEEQSLAKLAQSRSTLCIFLSGLKIDEVAGALIPAYGEDCPSAVVFHASWPDQKVVRGTLGEIARKASEAALGQTALILVGPALSRAYVPSRLYDRSFSHQYRTGKEP